MIVGVGVSTAKAKMERNGDETDAFVDLSSLLEQVAMHLGWTVPFEVTLQN